MNDYLLAVAGGEDRQAGAEGEHQIRLADQPAGRLGGESPGDAGVEALAGAEVLVYDRLVSEDLMALLPGQDAAA